MISRREFFGRMSRLGVGTASASLAWKALEAALPGEALAKGKRLPPVEAEYYTKHSDGTVTCGLCRHAERLFKGQVGKCKTRVNLGGTLKTYGCGQPCVLNVDPIEKNPLNHVLPGRRVLAIAHGGCNFVCHYCQNWQFSQEGPDKTDNLDFNERQSLDLAKSKSLVGVVFTYTEGTTHIEFNQKFSQAARGMGLRAFLCTNGYVQKKPLEDFLKLLDAVTITVKGFRDQFYDEYMGAKSYKPVLEACETVKAAGKWLEVATLIVPTMNDSDGELRAIAQWMAKQLGLQTPWHLQRFSPQFKLKNLPETPARALERARKIGLDAGLKFVYITNLAPHEGNHTYCPRCAKPVIKRVGLKVLENALRGGRCPSCSTPTPGVWA